MTHLELRPEEYQPQPPERRDYGIGLIGCGGIARGAHLPAYRQAGYRVVACCDLDEQAMRQAQTGFEIPFGTTDVDALLAHPDVEIVTWRCTRRSGARSSSGSRRQGKRC